MKSNLLSALGGGRLTCRKNHFRIAALLPVVVTLSLPALLSAQEKAAAAPEQKEEASLASRLSEMSLFTGFYEFDEGATSKVHREPHLSGPQRLQLEESYYQDRSLPPNSDGYFGLWASLPMGGGGKEGNGQVNQGRSFFGTLLSQEKVEIRPQWLEVAPQGTRNRTRTSRQVETAAERKEPLLNRWFNASTAAPAAKEPEASKKGAADAASGNAVTRFFSGLFQGKPAE